MTWLTQTECIIHGLRTTPLNEVEMSDNKTSVHFAHIGYDIICGFKVNSATPMVYTTSDDDKVTCYHCARLRAEDDIRVNTDV